MNFEFRINFEFINYLIYSIRPELMVEGKIHQSKFKIDLLPLWFKCFYEPFCKHC